MRCTINVRGDMFYETGDPLTATDQYDSRGCVRANETFKSKEDLLKYIESMIDEALEARQGVLNVRLGELVNELSTVKQALEA